MRAKKIKSKRNIPAGGKPEVVTVGSGMTKRTFENVPLDSPENVEKWAGDGDCTFEGIFGRRMAREYLSILGITESQATPETLNRFRKSDEKYRTSKWYAAELLWRLESLRIFRKRGDEELAIREAFELGVLTREAELKFKWAPLAMAALGSKRGRKLGRDKGNKKRKAKADEKHKKWCHQAQTIWTRRPKLSARSIATRVATRNESPEYISKVIARAKP